MLPESPLAKLACKTLHPLHRTQTAGQGTMAGTPGSGFLSGTARGTRGGIAVMPPGKGMSPGPDATTGRMQERGRVSPVALGAASCLTTPRIVSGNSRILQDWFCKSLILGLSLTSQWHSLARRKYSDSSRIHLVLLTQQIHSLAAWVLHMETSNFVAVVMSESDFCQMRGHVFLLQEQGQGVRPAGGGCAMGGAPCG